MDPSWEFQAPQFVDFNNLERAEDKKADEFFNVDMESGELWTTALEEAETADMRKDEGKADSINNQTATVAIATQPTLQSVSTAGPASTFSSITSTKTSIHNKTRRLANLVTSWGKGTASKEPSSSAGQGGSVSSYTSSSSAAKPPVKKRRRMSNAIIQTLALPSQTNNNKLLKLTPKRHQSSSITSYKSASPKRLGTNSSEPRLAVNMWKKKALLESNANKMERPQSAPASASTKFFSTVPKPFKLSTEKRAEERKLIDHRRKENEIRQERMRQAELERRKKESEEELLRYRQSLIHKAQPVKQFRKIEIKRSEKMLTLPESPQLTRGTKVRSQLRSL